MSSTQDALPQYINPQDTENMYHERRFECYATPRISNGLPSPCLTTPSNTRVITMDMSDESTNSTDYTPGSSLASSGYTSGCITPRSLSNVSSRRQSIIMPESQQNFLSSASFVQTSPTPGPRRKTARSQMEQLHLGGFLGSYSESSASSPQSAGTGSFQSSISSEDALMEIEAYRSRSHTMDWQSAIAVNTHGSSFSQALQMPVQSLSVDLAAGFNASLLSSEMNFLHQSVERSPMNHFPSSTNRDSFNMPSQQEYTHLPTLAEAFEPIPHPPSPSSRRSRLRRQPGLSSSRRRKSTKKAAWKEPISVISGKGSSNRIIFPCPKCPYAPNRNERLERHMRTHEKKEARTPHKCEICTKEFHDRPDNLKAHMKSTHFKYGVSEKGAKNPRYTMKYSMETNTRMWDDRWTQLLNGELRFGDTKDRSWKMLGYSIKETEVIKVKDLVPEWEGPDETTLKKFDPRWNKLLEGDMTFEQAMEIGYKMPETEKEGILGVDMMTSKEMGLQELDPRWKRLFGGSMSVEESAKLGVKELWSSVIEKKA